MKDHPSAKEVMLCWNPHTDQVRLVEYPDRENQSGNYECTALACYSYTREASVDQLKTICFIEAMHLIIRDKCDPMSVHNTMLKVREYRDGCANDMIDVE